MGGVSRAVAGDRQPRIGQDGDGLSDLGLLDPVVVDQQPLEERLAPLTAQVTRRVLVGALAIGEHVERLAERVLSVGERGLSGLKVMFGLGGLSCESIPLRPGELDGLALSYLREHVEVGPLTATTIARGLGGRSAGAVSTCLERLARERKVRRVKDLPRQDVALRPRHR